MTRTVLTSIAKTCPACGATNTVVAATTEIRPFWPMNCSRCGATVAESHRGGMQEPLDAGRAAPAAVVAGAPSAISAKRRAGTASRLRHLRRGAIARCCTGLHVAAGAALGVVGTILLLGVGTGPTLHHHAAGEGAVLAAVQDRHAAAGRDLRAGPQSPDRHAPGSAAQWDAAVETALEAELARLEATLGVDADSGRYLAAGPAIGGTPPDPEAAALAEAALELSRPERHELQRRLKLAQHDPRMVDGIFGPATRAAISRWQGAVGLPPTGYFDEQALALLERQTDDQFRAWQVAEQRDRRRRRTQTATVAASMPTAAPAFASCQRTWSGEIAYGQNVFCDFRGLRENVAQIFRAPERS